MTLKVSYARPAHKDLCAWSVRPRKDQVIGARMDEANPRRPSGGIAHDSYQPFVVLVKITRKRCERERRAGTVGRCKDKAAILHRKSLHAARFRTGIAAGKRGKLGRRRRVTLDLA